MRISLLLTGPKRDLPSRKTWKDSSVNGAAKISDETYFEALSRNSSRSGTSDQKEPKLRQRNYSPQFSLKHMAKDLRLALETAASFSLTLEQTAHLKQIYDRGMEAGWKEDDFIGLVRDIEKQ